jgi:DHA1 family tetracycline resistance protein-like MFS transporter
MNSTASYRRAFVFLLITATVDGIGVGIFIPIIPQLLIELTGKSIAHAAIYGGWLLALFAFVQFFAAPVLGSLSDHYGRRPVLLVSMTAIATDYVAYGLAPTIGWLVLADICAGIFSATLSTANAYVADITAPDDRARRFGMINAATGVGLVLGPMLAGLLEKHGARMPFFVVAVFALMNVVYGFLLLPESLRMENRRPFSILRANPLGTFMQLRTSLLGPVLLSCLGMMQIAALSVPVVWGYFTIQKFGWSKSDIGISLSLYASATIIVQGPLMTYLNRRLGDLRTACFGFCCMIIGLLGHAFSPQSWIMLVSIIPTALGSITGAALIGRMSNYVSADSQGELQGAVAGVASAAAILTPPLMTFLFGFFSAREAAIYFPGMPFLIAALIASLGLFLAIQAFKRDALLAV